MRKSYIFVFFARAKFLAMIWRYDGDMRESESSCLYAEKSAYDEARWQPLPPLSYVMPSFCPFPYLLMREIYCPRADGPRGFERAVAMSDIAMREARPAFAVLPFVI